MRTLGSEIMPGVCTCTTRWMNLMQHIRTPALAVSVLLNMFDLIAAICCHVAASSRLEILSARGIIRKRPILIDTVHWSRRGTVLDGLSHAWHSQAGYLLPYEDVSGSYSHISKHQWIDAGGRLHHILDNICLFPGYLQILLESLQDQQAQRLLLFW